MTGVVSGDELDPRDVGGHARVKARRSVDGPAADASRYDADFGQSASAVAQLRFRHEGTPAIALDSFQRKKNLSFDLNHQNGDKF